VTQGRSFETGMRLRAVNCRSFHFCGEQRLTVTAAITLCTAGMSRTGLFFVESSTFMTAALACESANFLSDKQRAFSVTALLPIPCPQTFPSASMAPAI